MMVYIYHDVVRSKQNIYYMNPYIYTYIRGLLVLRKPEIREGESKERLEGCQGEGGVRLTSRLPVGEGG